MSFALRGAVSAVQGCTQHVLQLHKVSKLKTSATGRFMSALGYNKDYLFRQLFDNRTYTYTYILADTQTKEAVIIDPVLELVPRDAAVIEELGLKPLYGINTHVHADHVTGTWNLKKVFPDVKSVISLASQAKADLLVSNGDLIKFGKYSLECRNTPGHTDGCMTYVWHENKMAFTGDALLIRGCGRTDFQQGSSERLYESVHNKILSLPSETLLYPGHDYTGQTVTTVAEEKLYNKRVTRSKEEFAKIMNNLNLPYPREIDRALPANMVCGFNAVPRS